MLFTHKHLEKKLREHGRTAPAEILHCKTEGQGQSFKAMFADDDDLTTGWIDCRLKLLVKPQDETPFEATVHARLHSLGSQGDTVPVLYDPDDHSKVVVDEKLELGQTRQRSADVGATDRVADRLEKLVADHESGAITDTEFEAEQAKLLDQF